MPNPTYYANGFLIFMLIVYQQLDRFIPNRSAMDFDYAHYMLTEAAKKDKENPAASSPSREAYRKQHEEKLNMHRIRFHMVGINRKVLLSL